MTNGDKFRWMLCLLALVTAATLVSVEGAGLIILPALAVAFAAFCLWLTVRIANRRERWAKFTLAAVVITSPVMYFGVVLPACAYSYAPVGTRSSDE